MTTCRCLSAVLTLGVILIASACGDTTRAANAAATRDSAGIQLADNTRPLWREGAQWRLSEQPLLDIGVDVGDPNYEFGSAHGPVRLSDGRIVVADMRSNQMRWYDPQGKYLMAAGGSGAGPGEFEQLYRLRKIDGDSLMALNPASLTSIFSSDGKYIRRFDLDPVRGRGNIWWQGRLSGGTLVAMSLSRKGTIEGIDEFGHISRPPKPENYRDSLMYFLYTMEGQLIDSIAELPGQWLGDSRVLVPNAASTVFGTAFYHSPGDKVEIRVFRSLVGAAGTGATRREGPAMRLEHIIRRAPLHDLAVNDSIKELYFAAERARFRELPRRNPEMAERMEKELANTAFPPTIPAHANRMYADVLGNLWLQEYRIGPGEPFRWSVFDPDGQWLGIVQTPAQLTVNEIGRDYVLGVWRDDFDVQHVRLYQLIKN